MASQPNRPPGDTAASPGPRRHRAPRIRTVKPEMWADEKIGALTRDQRLVFVGLITMADDAGRLRALLAAILGHVLPYDTDVTPDVLDGWLGRLADVGLIVRYEHQGVPYIAITGWARHQRIEKPSPSPLPAPPPDDSGSPPGTIAEHSGSAT